MDLIPIIEAYNNKKQIIHIYYTIISMHFIFIYKEKWQVIVIIAGLINIIKILYNQIIKFIQIDDEQTLGKAFK